MNPEEMKTPEEILAENTRLRENKLGEEYVECTECGAYAWGHITKDIEHNENCALVRMLKELE